MHLKKLTLAGFKSFAQPTELEFQPGLTAVVGPNGSGKSNIVDAILWAMGERSNKALRGHNPTDVIFSGSGGRKALNMAEVSLFFDNSDNTLPLDFEEVQVTRRLFRDGETQYSINKANCRLRDVHDLFLDTGIGTDSYCIISQGEMDAILSAKAEDRRGLIEGAAGVQKYHARRQETRRKLDRVQADLTRVHDIMHELDGQLGPLAAQAELAREYENFMARLRTLQLAVLARDYDVRVKRLQGLRETGETTGVTVEQSRSEIETMEAREATLDAGMRELQQSLPQDQRGAANTWQAVTVKPNGTLSCAVEAPTDLDHWTQGPNKSGDEADTVICTWTCTAGGFITGTNADGTYITAASQTGLAVTWLAPADPRATIKCTESNATDPTERHDVDVTREVNVTPGSDGAVIRFYRDAKDANGQPTPGALVTDGKPIGGYIWVALKVPIPPLAEIDPSTTDIKIRIEENSPLHDPPARLDQPLGDLTSGWEKLSPNGWDATANTSLMAENTGVDTITVRKKFRWNTMTQPLGHNATHTAALIVGHTAPVLPMAPANSLSTQTQDANEAWGNLTNIGPAAAAADIRNLVITGVTSNANNQDYMKYDPDSTDSSLKFPPVTFHIDDQGDPRSYRWEILIRDTRNDYEDTAVLSGKFDASGTYTVHVNNPDPSLSQAQTAPLAAWGTYAFDVHVQKLYASGTPFGDDQYLRPHSPSYPFPGKLQMADAMPPPNHDLDGHYVDFAPNGDAMQASASYFFKDADNLDASQVQVDLLDPSLTLKASPAGLPVGVGSPHLNQYLYTFNEDDLAINVSGDSWIALFRATDSHGKDYREHLPKTTEAGNQRNLKAFHIEEDWMSKGGVVFKALSDTKVLSMVYQNSGWAVQSKNVPGSHDVLNITGNDNPWGLQWRDPVNEEMRGFDSFRSFDHYDVRNSKRYIHVIGAEMGEAKDLYGISDPDPGLEQYSYVFEGLLLREVANNGDKSTDPIVKTAIHEVGHHFLLQHHPDNEDINAQLTSHHKLCVMDQSYPGNETDFWLCPRHAKELSLYSWPTGP